MSESNKPVKKKTPTWRVVLRYMIPIFLLIALFSGMVVGYVILGKRSIGEVFLWETWKHVYDLVFAPS